MNAGILLHGTPEQFAEFDNAIAFRPNAPRLHGLGTYLTRQCKQGGDVRQERCVIDSTGLRLANMYSFRMGAVVTETLNRMNRGTAYEVAIKKIAMDARRGDTREQVRP